MFDQPWLQKTISSPTFVPQEDRERPGGVWALVLQGETSPAQDTDEDHHPGRECCSFFNPINFSLNSKPLIYTLFSL